MRLEFPLGNSCNQLYLLQPDNFRRKCPQLIIHKPLWLIKMNADLRFLLILLTFLITSVNSSGQTNKFNQEENKTLKINGIFFDDLKNTNGDVALLKELFGEPIKVEEKQGGIEENWRSIEFSDIIIAFENVDLEDYQAFIYYIKAKSISMKGNTVSIGDPITNLGSDIVFNTGKDLTKSVVIDWGTCCSFIIEFDQMSGLVTEITYHVWT